jgi:hypothetical protein
MRHGRPQLAPRRTEAAIGGEQWEHGEAKDATALMNPAGERVLQRWPVSKRVNSSKADDSYATLIDRIEVEAHDAKAAARA